MTVLVFSLMSFLTKQLQMWYTAISRMFTTSYWQFYCWSPNLPQWIYSCKWELPFKKKQKKCHKKTQYNIYTHFHWDGVNFTRKKNSVKCLSCCRRKPTSWPSVKSMPILLTFCFLLIVESKILAVEKNCKHESMLTVWGKAQQL